VQVLRSGRAGTPGANQTMPGHRSGLRSGKGSSSFLKKRTKKLLFPWAELPERPKPKGPKVFCFFFSKKKTLPYCRSTSARST